MQTTGDRIRAARKSKGMTQGELAERVGVKYSAIHKYESGLVVNLKRETIAKLADALDVKPSFLMCLDDAPPKPTVTPDDLAAALLPGEQLTPAEHDALWPAVGEYARFKLDQLRRP